MANIKLYLPKNVKPIVSEKDPVLFGQVLTQATNEENIFYNFAIGSAVLKKEGDDVKSGELLAKKRTLFGKKEVKATVEGKIIRIDLEKGTLEISPAHISHPQVFSPVLGKVKKIEKGEITIEFDGELVFAKQGIGNMKKGLLQKLSKAEESVLLSHIAEEAKGKILLGGYFAQVVVEKALGIGAVCVVGTSFDEGTFLMHDASLALVAKVDYDTLIKQQGKEVVVEGIHKRIILQNG